jgi:hypothetical protein
MHAGGRRRTFELGMEDVQNDMIRSIPLVLSSLKTQKTIEM